jgi:hypothetical protein
MVVVGGRACSGAWHGKAVLGLELLRQLKRSNPSGTVRAPQWAIGPRRLTGSARPSGNFAIHQSAMQIESSLRLLSSGGRVFL